MSNEKIKFWLRAMIPLVIGMSPINIFAASSDYGRPWDDPDYHSSPIGKLMVPIAIIILILLSIGWIFCNKDKVIRLLKMSFYILCGGALVFGLIILPLLDRLDRPSNEDEINYTRTINYSHTSTSSDYKRIYTDIEKENRKPKEGEIGYHTKTYRIDICRYCHGDGSQKIEAPWGLTSVRCSVCRGTGREKIPGNFK